MTEEKDCIEVFIGQTEPFRKNEFGKSRGAAMIFVKEGTARIEIDFKPFELEANQLLLLAPSCNVLCKEQSEDFKVSGFRFSMSIAEDITRHFEPGFFAFLTEYPVVTIDSHDTIYLQHMIAGVNHILEHSKGEHRLQIAKNMIECFYLEHYDRNKERIAQRKVDSISHQEELFMQFLTLMHQHAAKERDASFYADRLCISTRYLSAIVRNQSGKTVKDFLDERCIQEIKILLRTTSENLQSIAIHLHFPDQSFFSRYFKKHTGMTPKEFRAGKESRS